MLILGVYIIELLAHATISERYANPQFQFQGSSLQECGPYVALKHWLQRSDVPLPPVRDAPMPSAERAIRAAQQSIQAADAVGAEWLQELSAQIWRKHIMEAYKIL